MPLNRFSLLLVFLPFLSAAQTFDNCKEIIRKGPYLSRTASISPTDDSLLYDTQVLHHCFWADSIDIQILDRMTVAGLALDLLDRPSWTYTDLWEAFLLYKQSDEYKETRNEIVLKASLKELTYEPEIYQFPDNGIPFKELITLEAALEEAKAKQKPLLIYFTAYACVNCRRLEEAVLRDERIQKIIQSNYLAYAAYCDDRTLLSDGKTKRGTKNATIQMDSFKSITQPAFYIVHQDGELKKAQFYPSDTENFLNFLKP